MKRWSLDLRDFLVSPAAAVTPRQWALIELASRVPPTYCMGRLGAHYSLRCRWSSPERLLALDFGACEWRKLDLI
jgi:hypothetical protein